MKKSQIISLVVSIMLIMAASYLFIKITNNRIEDVSVMQTLMPNRFIQSGEKIDESMIRVVSILNSKHDSDAYTDIKDVVGKVAQIPIGVTEEFLTWKLAKISLLPSEDEFFMTFRTDSLSNISNMIRAGDKVNINIEVATPIDIRSAGNKSSRIATFKVLENVTVASVKSADSAEIVDLDNSKRVYSDILDGRTEANDEWFNYFRTNPSSQPAYITFILNTQTYEALALALTKGQMKLDMYNPMNRMNLEDKKQMVSPSFYQIVDSKMVEAAITPVNSVERQVLTETVASEGELRE